jgi:CBS domain-containing protein
MAAVFAGAARTPLTAVILALELTHDTSALLPLLIACTMSDLVALGLLRHSLMTGKVAARGEGVGPEHELDLLAAQTVGQVMSTQVESVPQSLPLADLVELFDSGKGKHQGYPVVNAAGRLVGMVTRSDLPPFARDEALGWLVVADLLGGSPVVTWPQESLRDAADRMLEAGVGRLPVVAPEAPDRLVGMLSRNDLLKALVCQHQEEHHRERRVSRPAA